MKPILVTGAGKGLGAEISRQLAASGHDLVIHYYQSKKAAEALVEECNAWGVCTEMLYGDFSTMESLNLFLIDFLKRFPNAKGLVNNVGNYLKSPLLDTQVSQWQELFQVNFFSSIQLIQALLPSLKEQKGSILNIGVAGLHARRGFIKTTAYAATKSALFFYTLSLAKELIGDEVRVNMLSPGYMENAVDLRECPLNRAASLSEVARVAVFLFNPNNAYITGQNIEVAGGFGL